MQISVDFAIKDAFSRMKKVLFSPFNFVKWLTLGFIAFLTSLGRGGGWFNFNFQNPFQGFEGAEDFNRFQSLLQHNLAAIILLTLGILLISIAIAVLFLFLSSRGKFMLLHSITENNAQISIPWNQYSNQANNLFVFRLVFGLVSFFLLLIPIGFMLFLLFPNFKTKNISFQFFPIFILLFLVIFSLVVLIALINQILMDFVTPIMFKTNMGVMSSFSYFYKNFFKGNLSSFFLFYLLKFAFAIASYFLTTFICCLTCCIALIPYISSVVFLPITIFFELYSLSFLSQFGDDWNLYKWNVVEKTQKDEPPAENPPLNPLEKPSDNGENSDS